jgi:hypothetical protein
MYLFGNNSINSGTSSVRLPVVASLTIERGHTAAFQDVVIANDNTLTVPKPDHALSIARSIESVVRTSVEALGDAKALAKQIGLKGWYAEYLQKLVDDLEAEALPEIWALIERLETEVRRP